MRAAEAMLRLEGGINISRGSTWQRVQVWGAQLQVLAEQECQAGQCLTGAVDAAQSG